MNSLNRATTADVYTVPLRSASVPLKTRGQSLTASSARIEQRRKSVLSKRDQLMIVTQLSIMLRAGVDLAEAVRSVAQKSASTSIRSAVGAVYAELEGGKLLSQALAENRDQFGGVMVASVAAGEASGRLPEVLSRLSSIIRDEIRLRSAIRAAISYPLVLMFVTTLVLAAMIFFVLPQFGGIYASSRAPTPAITQLLLDVASMARSYWYLILGVGALALLGAWRFATGTVGRRKLDQVVFRLPLTHRIWASLLAGRMFRLQGAMLSSGVPMLEVLQLTKYSVSNVCYKEMIEKIEDSVVNGRGMSVVLNESSIIPDGAADMIATAEANGQLGSVLQTVGEFFESEGEQFMRDAVKVAEPAIIVVVGLVVGAIVLAVMLPMLDLSTAGGT